MHQNYCNEKPNYFENMPERVPLAQAYEHKIRNPMHFKNHRISQYKETHRISNLVFELYWPEKRERWTLSRNVSGRHNKCQLLNLPAFMTWCKWRHRRACITVKYRVPKSDLPWPNESGVPFQLANLQCILSYFWTLLLIDHESSHQMRARRNEATNKKYLQKMPDVHSASLVLVK